MSTDPDLHRLALAVENLNGTVQTGLTAVRGDINLLARGESENTRRIGELETDVKSLQDRRWPVQITQGVMSVAAVAIAGYAAMGR